MTVDQKEARTIPRPRVAKQFSNWKTSIIVVAITIIGLACLSSWYSLEKEQIKLMTADPFGQEVYILAKRLGKESAN